MGLRINTNLVEQLAVLRRAVRLAFQNRTEIHDLLGRIIEANPERIAGNNLE
jgi:hypothetical protein